MNDATGRLAQRGSGPSLLGLVLIVSCAHALVHVYELAFPSVEQLIAREFHLDAAAGKQAMGQLGMTWRLPFGLGALFVGWLVDRFGAKWMLVTYLAGCAATAVLAWHAPSLAILFGTMFLMGSFASIYHPAGLALISHAAPPHRRTAALGYHGILGSLGIAGAPFLATAVLGTLNWREYYLVLAVPGMVLAAVMALKLTDRHGGAATRTTASTETKADGPALSAPFFVLCMAGLFSGMVYAGLMNFLPRYLSGLALRPTWMKDEVFRNLLAAMVLLVGVPGQMLAGRLGRPGKLERQLAVIYFALVPLLVAMAFAQGGWRIVAAAAVSFVQFMNQPIYNSLIPQFVAARRRSLGYGISNTLGFGVGSLGAPLAGSITDDRLVYASLAGLALAGALVAAWLVRMRATREWEKTHRRPLCV
ncbi:MAG: MFS transporter [Planctomycetia bacterium]|nr:MFS transporter [Planctomycetia bacterium]